jgi:hypothetical protein
MHEKCLRNILLKTANRFSRTGCVMCLPPMYPVRPTGEHRFESIGGFDQHPNSSSDM